MLKDENTIGKISNGRGDFIKQETFVQFKFRV